MSPADALTVGRIALSPVYLALFLLGTQGPPVARSGALIALAGVFALIELSDLFDGLLARAMASVSDFGRILDPFADSVSRLTYFACFSAAGFVPLWVLMMVIYRDLGVSFLRLCAARQGRVIGARATGKLKAWVYAMAGVAGMGRLGVQGGLIQGAESAIVVSVGEWLFAACGLVAAGSLIDYLVAVLKPDSCASKVGKASRE